MCPTLAEIAEKKKKFKPVTVVRSRADIADGRRPYDLPASSEETQDAPPSPPMSDSVGNVLEPTDKQTDNKSAINRQQSDKKTGKKPTRNQQESDNKEKDIKNKISKTDKKPASKLTSEAAIKRQETDNKLARIWFFSELVGLERDIAEHIYKICQIDRSRITRPLTIESIAQVVKKSHGSVKNTLQHIEKKGIIKRVKFKNGRGGWSQYELPDAMYNEILHLESGNKLTINRQETDNKETSKPTSKLTIDPLSSSNLLVNNIKPTTGGMDSNIEWDLDIECLADIKFTDNHVQQLRQKTKHSSQIVQDAIYGFAHDLEKGLVARPKPGKTYLDIFFGSMLTGVYLPKSPDYINPQEKALQVYLEKRQAAKERNKKVEDELQREHFALWDKSLTENDRNNLISEAARGSKVAGYKRSELLKYHKNNIWPESRAQFYLENGLPLIAYDDE